MPSRNILKVDVAASFYHVYAIGAGKRPVFIEHADFEFFLDLCKRYLSHETYVNSVGTPYPKLYGSVELLAYCLMDNRLHLLLHQHKAGGMQRLMRGIMTSYSRYFNDKYDRSGPLFATRYKASRISEDDTVPGVSRYIHLIAKDWRTYPYSSIGCYLEPFAADWVQTTPVLAAFAARDEYTTFMADYPSAERQIETLRQELADSGQKL